MALIANGWDGLWSSLFGGLLSAVTVLIGVLLAQHLIDRRQHRDAVRETADTLLLEVASVRDAAVHSRSKARSGRYELWPLRHALYLSHALRGSPVADAVHNYYEAVWELRNWIRHGPVAQGDRPFENLSDEQAVIDYQRAIDDWADALIEALSDLSAPLSDRATVGPARPQLPR
ncbi:hypothetical protein [Nocardioides alkalitolerans]|uniref:hypothetical protein n=1 Tax=Nocardioides alkalitolerans TaxID=281714 RepID=UPI0012F84449|nr:hypothetical protein [Nocardioides alkalitolerans]